MSLLTLVSYPIQLLMAEEIRKAVKRCATIQHERILNQVYPECDCKFFRKYFLPCRHMFQLDFLKEGGWLNDAIWDTFIQTSGESGFEVYYTRERELVDQPTHPLPNKDVVQFKSHVEQLSNIFWRLREENDIHKIARFEAVLQGLNEEFK